MRTYRATGREGVGTRRIHGKVAGIPDRTFARFLQVKRAPAVRPVVRFDPRLRRHGPISQAGTPVDCSAARDRGDADKWMTTASAGVFESEQTRTEAVRGPGKFERQTFA
jgi:hypothetical protein